MASSWTPSDETRERIAAPDASYTNHLWLLNRYDQLIRKHLLDGKIGIKSLRSGANSAIKVLLQKSKDTEFGRLRVVVQIMNSLSRSGVRLPPLIAYRKYCSPRTFLSLIGNTVGDIEYARELYRLFPMSHLPDTKPNDDRFYAMLSRCRIALPSDAVVSDNVLLESKPAPKRSSSDIESPASPPASQRVHRCEIHDLMGINPVPSATLLSFQGYNSEQSSLNNTSEQKSRSYAQALSNTPETSHSASNVAAPANAYPSLPPRPPSPTRERPIAPKPQMTSLLQENVRRIQLLEKQVDVLTATNNKHEQERARLAQQVSDKDKHIADLRAWQSSTVTQLDSLREQLEGEQKARVADEAQLYQERIQLEQDQQAVWNEKIRLQSAQLALHSKRQQLVKELANLEYQKHELQEPQAGGASPAISPATTRGGEVITPAAAWGHHFPPDVEIISVGSSCAAVSPTEDGSEEDLLEF